MTLFDTHGRLITMSVARYRVAWEKQSRSKFQFQVKKLLKPIWYIDVVFEEFPVFGTRLRLDFYNATKKIAVEVNGPQHEKYNPFFHGDSPVSFIKGIKRDLHKHSWCAKNQITLVEILPEDLKDSKEFYRRIQSS